MANEELKDALTLATHRHFFENKNKFNENKAFRYKCIWVPWGQVVREKGERLKE